MKRHQKGKGVRELEKNAEGERRQSNMAQMEEGRSKESENANGKGTGEKGGERTNRDEVENEG